MFLNLSFHIILNAYISDYIHTEIHTEGSWLEKYNWFQNKRKVHLLHHKITTKNTVIHSYPVDLKNNFNILKDISISQKLNLATIGKTTLNMELRGEREVTFSEYTSFINTTISKFKPKEDHVHIASSPKISFTPKKNSMTFNVEWNWLTEVADI